MTAVNGATAGAATASGVIAANESAGGSYINTINATAGAATASDIEATNDSARGPYINNINNTNGTTSKVYKAKAAKAGKERNSETSATADAATVAGRVSMATKPRGLKVAATPAAAKDTSGGEHAILILQLSLL